MSLAFCLLSALMIMCVAHALWPLRRPWWLKLPSFNCGWMANELPLHALAGNMVAVAAFALLGGLDGWSGRIGLVLTATSSIGLLVLARAHRYAGAATDTALRETVGDADPRPVDHRPVPRSWLVLPWLAWGPAPGVERIANVVYATVNGRDLKLDLYRPTSRLDGQACPVLVEIHGGGWITGDRRLEARPLIARMAARGWVCISIDYRVGRSATWPDHIVDVNTALGWVRDHVADYGGDADFVAITGGSAGGHLAALASLCPGDSEFLPGAGTGAGSPAEISACVPFYGAYDFSNSLSTRATSEQRMLERHVVRRPQADAPAVYHRAAPLDRVTPNAPPFFVIQGTSDNLVSPTEARAFVDRLREVSRSPVAYAEVPRGQHAFDAVPSVRTAHVITAVERFLTSVHATHRTTAADHRGA